MPPHGPGANFSAGGAAGARRLMADAGSQLTDPEAEARAAFGLTV
ncbi:hypothetical protein PV341_42250 [Streptomyces sp. PA03-1a]|nr:hypothetical protein [Streptomyces sp. PA03-1a]MDX2818755.1 hypothetical protein [Streptomyces sp. PA03-5A]